MRAMSRSMIDEGSRNGGTTRSMPPATSRASKIVTATPLSASDAAAESPDGPLPTTAILRPTGARGTVSPSARPCSSTYRLSARIATLSS